MSRPAHGQCEEDDGVDGEEEDDRSSWLEAPQEPDEQQTKKLVGVALKITIIACLKNHAYNFKGSIFKQGKKEVIGLDLERCICNIFIGEWCKDLIKLLEKIEENSKIEGLDLKLKKTGIYVDDHYGIHRATPKGGKFNRRQK